VTAPKKGRPASIRQTRVPERGAWRQDGRVTHVLCPAICGIGGGPPLDTRPQPDLPCPGPNVQEVAVAKDQMVPVLNFHVWIPPPVHHDRGAVVQERGCMAGPG
jgi:hypothetical protein